MEGKFGHDVGHMGTLQPFAFPEEFWSEPAAQTGTSAAGLVGIPVVTGLDPSSCCDLSS